MSSDSRRAHAPATQRNREPILAVLRRVLPARGLLLEIASGTGEHAAFMAPQLPGLDWQPSDARTEALADIDGYARDSGCARIRPAIRLDVAVRPWPVARADAVFCANMIHIAPWQAAEGLLAGAAESLAAGAPLVLYGPFRRDGSHTAPSNERFDAALRSQDPRWGVRCLDAEVTPLAERRGFRLDEVVAMPANNLMVVFRRV
jgi:hypothetical protein